MTADTTDPAAPSGTAAPARKKASDFHPRILEIFDGYVHGKLTKRQFIEQAGKYAAAGVTGAMLLDQLKPDYAQGPADCPAKGRGHPPARFSSAGVRTASRKQKLPQAAAKAMLAAKKRTPTPPPAHRRKRGRAGVSYFSAGTGAAAQGR